MSTHESSRLRGVAQDCAPALCHPLVLLKGSMATCQPMSAVATITKSRRVLAPPHARARFWTPQRAKAATTHAAGSPHLGRTPSAPDAESGRLCQNPFPQCALRQVRHADEPPATKTCPTPAGACLQEGPVHRRIARTGTGPWLNRARAGTKSAGPPTVGGLNQRLPVLVERWQRPKR